MDIKSYMDLLQQIISSIRNQALFLEDLTTKPKWSADMINQAVNGCRDLESLLKRFDDLENNILTIKQMGTPEIEYEFNTHQIAQFFDTSRTFYKLAYWKVLADVRGEIIKRLFANTNTMACTSKAVAIPWVQIDRVKSDGNLKVFSRELKYTPFTVQDLTYMTYLDVISYLYHTNSLNLITDPNAFDCDKVDGIIDDTYLMITLARLTEIIQICYEFAGSPSQREIMDQLETLHAIRVYHNGTTRTSNTKTVRTIAMKAGNKRYRFVKILLSRLRGVHTINDLNTHVMS